MAVAASQPVTIIEGIGPAAAEALKGANVFLVFDLLRGSVQTIHRAVRGQASVEQVKSWRAMSALLQVAQVTPQWAEALAKAGVISVEMLFRKQLEDIEAIMTEAKAAGVIQDVPTATQIADMLRDAAVLTHSGSITGTVRDQTDEAISGATIRVGGLEQQTDERGRFRILRVPLAADLPLYILHDNFVTRTIEAPPVSRNLSVINGRIFRMTQSPQGTPEASTALSELAGDLLPVPTGQRLRSVDIDAANLRPRDVLKVYKLYERSPDAGLVSYFKSYEAGEFLVHTLKVPVSSLGQNVQLGDQFQVKESALTKVNFNRTQLHRYKLRQRLRKMLAGRAAPTGADERNTYLSECDAFLRGLGYFNIR